jgi:hypothetical protein
MNSLMKKCLVALLLLTLVAVQVQQAQAAKGMPGSPEFGFGVSIHPDGPFVDEALNLLSDLHPDWLYVPVAWAAVQPAGDVEPDLAVIDKVLSAAAGQQTAVAISLSQAPAWALTDEGPNVELTAQFVALLAQRYPQVVQTLELFPRANTLAGWGSAPNPHAYLTLFTAVQDRLKADGSPVVLVAAGLQPLGKSAEQIDPALEMDDLVFLQGLYDAGGRDRLPVISLQYADTSADLMASPYSVDVMIFRHYEMVRATMLANQHSAGMIWITGFGLPSGAYDQKNVNLDDLAQQETLLLQAYYQAHAQLYIGSAILQSLNPAAEGTAERVASILQPDGSRHPFYQQFRQMTIENNPGDGASRPGSAKKGNLLKHRQ